MTRAPNAQTAAQPPVERELEHCPPGGRDDVPVEHLTASAYTIPTDHPESNGTFEWTSTTIVIAEASAGGTSGLGYSYTHEAAAALDVPAAWDAMVGVVRNIGRVGWRPRPSRRWMWRCGTSRRVYSVSHSSIYSAP